MSTAPSSRSTPPSRSSPTIPSTRATSPPTSPATIPEDIKTEDENEVGSEAVEANSPKDDPEEQDEDVKERLVELENLIQRSGEYVKLLKTQMDQVKVNYGARRQKPKSEVKTKLKPRAKNTRKRSRVVSDSEDEREAKRTKAGGAQEEDGEKADEGEKEKQYTFQQPALVTGATLKDYQLEGVAWMAGLHQNGISGILADEMGLGKTIQTISFHAFLRERTSAPFMVVCPLAVLDNWAKEFARFAPDIPVVTYYGTKEERAEIRRTQMVMDEVDLEYHRRSSTSHAAAMAAPTPSKRKGKGKGKATARGGPKTRGRGRGKATGRGRTTRDEDSSEDEAPPAKSRRTAATRGRRGGRAPARSHRRPLSEADSDEFEDSMTIDEEIPAPAEERNKHPLKPHQRTNFPVVLTTYQIIINDRAELSHYHWGFIVVDEGHRLKNMDCVLMREIKRIPADARMVLTGTPLQNNLAELWALLNFVLPDLFGDLSMFQSWFDESRLKSKLTSDRETKLIDSLHDILRPFLLRRMKADVEMALPPKKEYVLYTPLSEPQRALYDVVVQGDKALRQHLIDEIRAEEERLNGGGRKVSDDEEERPLKQAAKDKVRTGKGLRKKVDRDYVESSDEDGEGYFKRLDEGQIQMRKEKERSGEDIGREWQMRVAVKEVNNKNLKNVIMQLRKVCQHPFLFHWSKDARTREPVLGDELVTTSGKMMVLERLLDALFARDHKVLLFSQFTTMLDIIEDWAVEHKGWPICRIDGSMGMESRREDIRRFQEGGDAPDAPRLFLLSTRSGGLGLNLVQADTVIFYDQDWNPQADLQAQDRAHRIGQTRPVLIFRLLCAHTVETKIMQRATDKRKLEALVIAKGEFVNPTIAAKRNKNQALAELAMQLHRLEGERIQVVPSSEAGKASVISDEELEMLLDRSPEVFLDRQKGWTSGGQVEGAEAVGPSAKIVVPDAKGARTAFAVYEAPVHADGNVLGMMDLEDEADE
ncbi:SNF2 family N-terminal domain-containing protein [Ganoderma leucocontextum]|nr:SNF2 family N-terminal domain-containing protein [Ganoderma leucocontextum]